MPETKKRKRPRKVSQEVTSVPDDEELKILEKIVLGTGSDIFEGSRSDEDSDDEVSAKKGREVEKKPAWVDEDDVMTYREVVQKRGRQCASDVVGSRSYESVTKKKFEQVMATPKWAKASNQSDHLVGGLLNTCGKFLKKPKFLDRDLLEFEKLKNLNYETKSEGSLIKVVKFHPKSTVAMVGGVSGVLSLFQVDGKQNPKLQSLHFEKYPIDCGAFIKSGEQVIIGSMLHKFFYSHDLITGKSMKLTNSKLINITKTNKFCVSPKDDFFALCGNSGKILLFATSTKEYVDCLQMNCGVTAVAFSHDGSLLYSHGEDGEVYIWEMKSRTCMKKFYDDGCLTGTSIGVSPNDQFIACGSSSGVVNIYDCQGVHSGQPLLPTKSLFNLVVPATSTRFNASSEVLAIASDRKDNALRLVHCSSMTVFSNFPEFNSSMKKPLCLDFSPNSGFFAVGDSSSRAHLFRLKYFGNY